MQIAKYVKYVSFTQKMTQKKKKTKRKYDADVSFSFRDIFMELSDKMGSE